MTTIRDRFAYYWESFVDGPVTDLVKRLPYELRVAVFWLMGYPRCLDGDPGRPGTFCKRRAGHIGAHRTSSGYRWRR